MVIPFVAVLAACFSYFFGYRRRHSARASRSFSSHGSGSNETRMYLAWHMSPQSRVIEQLLVSHRL
jgi:hypothetical protein